MTCARSHRSARLIPTHPRHFFDQQVQDQVVQLEKQTDQVNNVALPIPGTMEDVPVHNKGFFSFICTTKSPAKNGAIPKNDYVRDKGFVSAVGLDYETIKFLMGSPGLQYFKEHHDHHLVTKGSGPM